MTKEGKEQLYVDKWIRYGVSTDSIDKDEVKKIVKRLYEVLEADNKNPEIVYCDSPNDIVRRVAKDEKIDEKKAWEKIKSELNNGQFDADYFAFYDFIYNEAKYEDEDKNIIEVLMNMGKHVSFYYTTENKIYISHRPLEINRDNEGRLHADGRPAFVFQDGWCGYYWHGREMPEIYGRTKSSQWQPKWILSEKNVELKRILLQQIHNNIGYGPMLNQLKATKLDEFSGVDISGASFHYELFRIDDKDEEGRDIDVEPIYLLKMICPTTGAIYVHRVAPSNSAEESIVAINRGIHPSKFKWQT